MNFQDQPDKAYYDAVMVGFSNHLDSEDVLIARKQKVIEATQKLFVFALMMLNRSQYRQSVAWKWE
ncbi:hypothetical protein [Coleofasciculus sp. G2-EDA-02]|uniref:hypothetical protein n=1 Tax=Coleofasciculus sp. G2-EDA-02 TaxID=3069529 RepID=UPI003304483B